MGLDEIHLSLWRECVLRPSAARGEVPAHVVDHSGALLFAPGCKRDDQDRRVVI